MTTLWYNPLWLRFCPLEILVMESRLSPETSFGVLDSSPPWHGCSFKKQWQAHYWASVQMKCHFHAHLVTLKSDSPIRGESTRLKGHNKLHLSSISSVFKDTAGLPQQHLIPTLKCGSTTFGENFTLYLTSQYKVTSSTELSIHWCPTVCLGLVRWWFGWAETPGSWCSYLISAPGMHNWKPPTRSLSPWAEPKAILMAIVKASLDRTCYIFTNLSY